MKESVCLSLIRLWAALAWADNNLSPEQEQGLKRLVQSSTWLSDAEQTAARSFYAGDPVSFDLATLDEPAFGRLSNALREKVYLAAVHLHRLARNAPQREREFLRQLRARLRVADSAAAELEAQVT